MYVIRIIQNQIVFLILQQIIIFYQSLTGSIQINAIIIIILNPLISCNLAILLLTDMITDMFSIICFHSCDACAVCDSWVLHHAKQFQHEYDAAFQLLREYCPRV